MCSRCRFRAPRLRIRPSPARSPISETAPPPRAPRRPPASMSAAAASCGAPSPSPASGTGGGEITYVSYGGEQHLPLVMSLVDAELSEPYSIFTYRYFVYLWPQLTFLVRARPPSPLPAARIARGLSACGGFDLTTLSWFFRFFLFSGLAIGGLRRRSMPRRESAWARWCARWGSTGAPSGATSPCSSSSSPTEEGE